MASEGSREIDAAKRHLAAAKAQASGASTNMNSAAKSMESAKAMMEAAKAMMENAESQLNSSSKEVEDAEKFLEEAEKRWNVIDIDQEPDSPKENSNKKRRKSLLSPQESSVNDNQCRPSDATGNGTSSGTALSSSNLANGSRLIDQVAVEGSGMEEVNGTFRRVVGKLIYGVPVYSKKGKWKGQTVNFVIFRGRLSHY